MPGQERAKERDRRGDLQKMRQQGNVQERTEERGREHNEEQR